MHTAWSIDWLSVTFKTGFTDLQLRKACSFGFPLKTWAIDKGKFGYSTAFIHPFGLLVMSNHSRPEMGVHLAFSGRALHSLAEHDITGVSLLQWALENGGRVTRLDLAIDAFEVEIDPITLASCPRIALEPGSARKWSSVKGHDGGATAYIGSRKSEKFLRIYNKAAEQHRNDILWTRLELELKSDSARAAANQFIAMTDEERPQFIKGMIKALFNPNDTTFQAVIHGADTVKLPTVKDTDDKTLQWIMGTVAHSIAKTMARRADIDVWEELTAAVHNELTGMGFFQRSGSVQHD